MYLAEALILRLAGGSQTELGVAADEAVRLEPGDQGVGGVGIEAGPLQQPGEVGPRVGRTAGGEQAEGVPGLRHGVALGELLAQDRGEGALGEAEGLAELTVDSRGVGHRGLSFTTVDRLLSIIALRQEPVYMPSRRDSRHGR